MLCSFVPLLGTQHNLKLYLLFVGDFTGETISPFSPRTLPAGSCPAPISHLVPPEVSEFSRM